MIQRFTTSIVICSGLVSLCGFAWSADESPGLDWTTLEIGLKGGTHNLEGPAVTGQNDREGEDEAAIGAYVDARLELNDWLHLRADVSYERIGSDVGLFRGFIGPGVRWSFSPGWAVGAELGLAGISVSGLEGYDGRTVDAMGSGGSDIGFQGQIFLRHRINEKWEWHIAAGYQAYGSTDYEDGLQGTISELIRFDLARTSPAVSVLNLVEGRSLIPEIGDQSSVSPGDGPHYSLGVTYHWNDSWSLSASWRGAWIEDGGTGIDLATQGLRVGTRWTF